MLDLKQSRHISRLMLLPFLACACSTVPLTGNAPNEVPSAYRQDAARPSETRFAMAVADQMEVWAVHNPIYKEAQHDAVITARAKHPNGQLGQIEIEVTLGTITDCTELNPGDAPSVIPCRGGATTDGLVCEFPGGEAAGECKFGIEVMTDSIISYRATATSLAASSVSTPNITFSGGIPGPAQIRPIWWHSDPAALANEPDRISLGLFPDRDFDKPGQGFPDFASHVNEIIGEAYFNDTQNFAREYTANRHYFDLWVGPMGADTVSGCGGFWYDFKTAPARAVVHSGAIIHADSFQDCADIEYPGNGSVSANSYYDSWLLVHESAHFMFGLGDEHEYGGLYSCSNPPNVFNTETDCNATLTDISAPDTAICIEIPGTGKFRIDEQLWEVMLMQKHASDFRTSSANAVANQLSDCLSGVCYVGGTPQCPTD